ncbi:MAG: hypothetical protein OXU20_01590 [Myxococcales bacterium]|nr:hypothetical protein [Myxococcales bacterium]MDD9972291.1 hypothetical protein [Myxococcales bacterium]
MGRNLCLVLLSLVALAACSPEGPSAFVDISVVPDSECIYRPGTGEGALFKPIGLYDIATDGDPDVTDRGLCENPYLVWLRVNSQLRPSYDMELGRSEPNVLQITRAEVRLMDQQQRTLVFDMVDPPLPNPFLVNTNLSLPPTDNEEPSVGVAAVEVIPTSYASSLSDLINDQILAEIQFFGKTLGDVEVDIAPYLYPIRICHRCLVRCAGSIDFEELEMDDECQDNAGYDGRLCIDESC